MVDFFNDKHSFDLIKENNFFKDYFDLNNAPQTSYILEDKIKNYINANKNFFSIMSLNIRSLQSNLSKCANMFNNFDLIAIQETWTQFPEFHKLDGYSIIGSGRGGRRGGGTCFYIKDSIPSEELSSKL